MTVEKLSQRVLSLYLPISSTPSIHLPTLHLSPHLRDGVGEQAVELLVGAVPDPAPAGRVKVLPDASQADGHPLAQQGVRVRQLLQTDGYQVPLETGLLGEDEERETGGEGRRSMLVDRKSTRLNSSH